MALRTLLVLLSFLFLASGCELPKAAQILEGMCFETYHPADRPPDEPWSRTTFQWKRIMNAVISQESIPVLVPIHDKPGLVNVGQIRSRINPNRNQSMDTYVELNVALLGQQPPQAAGNRLPNGLLVPMGAQSETMFKLAINNPHTPARDYFHFDVTEGSIVLGLTYEEDSMDEWGQQVKAPMNLFLPLKVKDQDEPIASAGVYLSPLQGQNGYGAFVDASVLIGDLQAKVCTGGQ